MRYVLSAFWVFSVCFIHAQDTAVSIPFGKIELNVHSAAGLGVVKPACTYGGKPLVKKLSVWLTGISWPGQDTVALANDIFGVASSWCEGPASISGNVRLSRNEWPGLWQVGKLEVLGHRKNFLQTGYKTPEGIAGWPGTFVKKGFASQLAPFADVNLDGAYNAADGDFPYVPGDFNVWSMVSDSAGKSAFLKNEVNVDLSSIWFNVNAPDTVLNGTALNRLTLCNRSAEELREAKLSLAVDFAIGDVTDDYLATDVTNKALLGLNADAQDAVFGANPPAAAVGWLSAKVAGSMRFEQGNDAVQGAPEKAAHFFNLAAAKWKTGKPLGFGGRGLDATGKSARFIYPGSTDINAPRSWSESGEGNNPGRRTGLISTDTFTLNGGQCRVFDAFLTVFSSGKDELTISKNLQKVQDAYATLDFTLFAQASNNVKKNTVYPNPAERNEPIFLSTKPLSKVGICDSKGSYTEMFSGSLGELRFDKPGIYRIIPVGGAPAVVVVY